MADDEPTGPVGKDDDFESRLREIEAAAERRRSPQSMPEPPEWDYKRRPRKGEPSESDRESYRGLAFGITLAYMLVGPLIAGWGIGYLVDRSGGDQSNQWQTWGTVIGLFAGFIVVAVMITKSGDRR